MKIVAIDAGNFGVKVVTEKGVYYFKSFLGEWVERKADVSQRYDSDLEFEFNGKKGFAGSLAEAESYYLRETGGETKAHEDTLIRILLALHQFGSDFFPHQLVIGQPISCHAKDKQKLVDMVKGEHEITVNGVNKKITIANVAVAAEGAAVYWTYKGREPKVRIIDVGSSTVNLATIHDNRFVNRDSDTLPYGSRTNEDYDPEQLAKGIISKTTKLRWGKHSTVLVCGGIAEQIFPYLAEHFTHVTVHQPMYKTSQNTMKLEHPMHANALGCYELAKVLYEKA